MLINPDCFPRHWIERIAFFSIHLHLLRTRAHMLVENVCAIFLSARCNCGKVEVSKKYSMQKFPMFVVILKLFCLIRTSRPNGYICWTFTFSFLVSFWSFPSLLHVVLYFFTCVHVNHHSLSIPHPLNLATNGDSC